MGKWKMVKLGDVCNLNMGQSPDSSSYNQEGNGVPFYQGNADFGDLHPVTRFHCSNPTKIANEGDILISIRAPIGALNIATETCCIGRGLAALTVKEELLDTKYLFYILTHKHDELNHMGTGSTFKAINKQILRDVSMLLPNLQTQRKIADILDTVSNMLALRKQQLAELDNLIRSIFYDMFGDPMTNDKGWDVYTLEDITLKIGSGATPRGGKQSYKDSGVSLIRSMNVYNGAFKYDELAHINDEQARQLDNVIIEENDVLINITGASVARTCIVPKDILPARVNQHVSIIRVNQTYAVPEYINSMLIFPSYQANLLSLAGAGGATREAITKQQLMDIRVAVPPLDIQQQFVEMYMSILKQRVRLQRSLDETQHLFDSLMSRYFD